VFKFIRRSPASHRQPLSFGARLYLGHIALLTLGLAISELFFNLAVLALGYPLPTLGLLNAIGPLAAACSSLPIWWLVIRLGSRAALLIATILRSAFLAGVALAGSVEHLAIAVVLGGVAAVFFQAGAAPLMMRYSNDQTRDRLFSAGTALQVGLGGLGSLFAGGLPLLLAIWFRVEPESAGAYRAMFLIAGVVVLGAVAPLLLMPVHTTVPPADPPPPEPAHNPGPVTEAPAAATTVTPGMIGTFLMALRTPVVLKLMLPMLLVGIGAALLIPYLNLFFKARFGISDLELGIIFAIMDIGTGLAMLATPLVSGRLGKMRAIVVTRLLALPFLLLLGWAAWLPLAVATAFLRVVLANMSNPLYDAFAMEQSPEALRPVVIGLLSASATVGLIIAPPISTAIQAQFGFGPLFAATTLLYAAAVALIWWWFVRIKNQESRTRNREH
jgi:MFS family permease